MNVTRRAMFKTAVATLVAGAWWWSRFRVADAAEELKVPDSVPTDKFDFEARGIEGWTTVDGQWAVEAMAGAPSGKKVLVQRTTKNTFNVIVAPPGAYTYDRGRRQLASASVRAPALGQWHTVRFVAIGDHMQAWLDGKLYLDHRDSRSKSGRVDHGFR